MDRKAWHAAVHGVANSCIRLSDCTELTEERTDARELRRQAERNTIPLPKTAQTKKVGNLFGNTAAGSQKSRAPSCVSRPTSCPSTHHLRSFTWHPTLPSLHTAGSLLWVLLLVCPVCGPLYSSCSWLPQAWFQPHHPQSDHHSTHTLYIPSILHKGGLSKLSS